MGICEGLEAVGINESGLVGLLAYPTSCDYYFYLKLMIAFFIVITTILYSNDKRNENIPSPDLWSSLGVSSIVTIVISLIGTMIGFIQADIFAMILVTGLIFIGIWMLRD